jgi:hypothetical protein
VGKSIVPGFDKPSGTGGWETAGVSAAIKPAVAETAKRRDECAEASEKLPRIHDAVRLSSNGMPQLVELTAPRSNLTRRIEFFLMPAAVCERREPDTPNATKQPG